MEHADIQTLREELEEYKKEKENIRTILGQIGGKASSRREKVINIIFIFSIALLFCADISRHAFHINIPLPPMFSLELGVLLVSLKIIWMMHRQAKVEHFQFWILNSIEFRLNAVSKQISNIEKKVSS